MGFALALALAAGPVQADEPRILESAARLAAEVQLHQTVQQGGRPRMRRMPFGAKAAMIAGGATLFYFSAVNLDYNGSLAGVAAGAAFVVLGVALMV